MKRQHKYLKRLKLDRSVKISYSKWRRLQQQQWRSSDVAFYAPYHTNIMQTGRKFTIFSIFESFVNKSVATAVKIFGGCIPQETHQQASRTLIEGNLEIDKIDIWKYQMAGISNPFHFFMRPSAYNLDSRELKLLLWKFVFATASRRFYSWITFDTFLPEFFIFGSIGFWRGLSRKPIFFRGYIESHSY